MVKRIKNWDKLNDTRFVFDNEVLSILTDKVVETDDSNEYYFGVWNLHKFVLKGRLVITQAKAINLKSGDKDLVNEYVITITANDKSKFITQHILMEEVMKDFELFKHQLAMICQKMLKNIKETTEWTLQSGYTL